jgi:DNA-binding response OmpR family regulator
MSIGLDAADIIVIVDDDPLVADLIAEVLRDLAASVLCPTTTEAAIGLLASSRYRLAVVDFGCQVGRVSMLRQSVRGWERPA